MCKNHASNDSWKLDWKPALLMNCPSKFSKQISHFHRPFAASKANCGWYLDAAVSALRTLDRKIFRSKYKFFNEQAESTYFRQFAKMDNIYFFSKLNLRRNSGRPNERTHVSVWCQIAHTLDKNQDLLKFCFKKKPFAVYIRVSGALGIKFGGALIDGTEVFW